MVEGVIGMLWTRGVRKLLEVGEREGIGPWVSGPDLSTEIWMRVIVNIDGEYSVGPHLEKVCVHFHAIWYSADHPKHKHPDPQPDREVPCRDNARPEYFQQALASRKLHYILYYSTPSIHMTIGHGEYVSVTTSECQSLGNFFFFGFLRTRTRA